MNGGWPEVDRIAVGGRALDRGWRWGSGVCFWSEWVFGERDSLFLALFQRGVEERFFGRHVGVVAVVVVVDEDTALLGVDIEPESRGISGVDAEYLSRRTNLGRVLGLRSLVADVFRVVCSDISSSMFARQSVARLAAQQAHRHGAGPHNARNMATLREIELRLKSVRNIEKITKVGRFLAPPGRDGVELLSGNSR